MVLSTHLNQISCPSDDVLSDSVWWSKITSSFIATSFNPGWATEQHVLKFVWGYGRSVIWWSRPQNLHLSVGSVWTSSWRTHYCRLHLYLSSIIGIFGARLRCCTLTHRVSSNYLRLRVLTDCEVEWRSPECRHRYSAKSVCEGILCWAVAKRFLFLESSILNQKKDCVISDRIVIVEGTCPRNLNVDARDWSGWSWRSVRNLTSLERNWNRVTQSRAVNIHSHHLVSILLTTEKSRVSVRIHTEGWWGQSSESSFIYTELNNVVRNQHTSTSSLAW